MTDNVVNFPSEHASGDGVGVVFGDVSKSKIGLIVIHEWWGKNQQIQDQGAMMAEEGNCVVLVPDLYRGNVAIDKEDAGHLMSELDWDGAVKDVTGAAKYLKSLGCTKVCVSGFCMGGALSFAAAAVVKEIDAAVPFYGIPDETKFDLTKISVPVQMHFASQDQFFSKEDYTVLYGKLKDAGVKVELFEYDAGHAFVNPENKIGPNYRKDLAELAFGRVFEFLQQLAMDCKL